MGIKRAIVVFFFGIIAVISFFTIVLPKADDSELENRSLQKAPVISVDNLKSGKFMKDTEAFLTDHLIGRQYFVEAKTMLELASGKQEINGVFVSKKRLIEDVKRSDKKPENASIAAMNAFAEKYGEKTEISAMLIPTAEALYPDELPLFAEPLDQSACIKEIYGKLEGIEPIDVYSSLVANASDYVFYRTDHHWTSRGAYIGYTAMARTLGFKAATADMFNIEHASHDFLGTLYSKVVYKDELADSVDLYHYAQSDVISEVIKITDKNIQSYPSIFFREKLDVKDKYSVFMGGNDAVVKIKTKADNGRKLLVFKDSYSNSLMQFLSLHYEEIALVDLRYLNKPLDEVININDYKQCVFFYGLSTFLSDTNIKKLSVLS